MQNSGKCVGVWRDSSTIFLYYMYLECRLSELRLRSVDKAIDFINKFKYTSGIVLYSAANKQKMDLVILLIKGLLQDFYKMNLFKTV